MLFCMPEVTWNVDMDTASLKDAREIRDQIESQVEPIQVRGSGTGSGEANIILEFVFTVGSQLTAHAIYDALKEREETEDVDIDVDVSGDADVEINIDK